MPPQRVGIVVGQIRAQQITAFAPAHGPQSVTIKLIREGALQGHSGVDQPRRGAGFASGLAEFEEQFVTGGRFKSGEFAEALPIFFQRAAAHRALLVHAGRTLGEHVNFAVRI